MTIPAQQLGGRAQRRFEEGLADLLSAIAGGMRAGIGFDQALRMAAEASPKYLHEEVGLLLADIGSGRTRADAFGRLLARHPTANVEFLAAAVAMSEMAGGNLTRVLDTIAATMRERARMAGDLKSMTAQSRLSGTVLAMVPVILAVLLSVIAPDYFSPVFSSKWGWGILGVAACLAIAGMLIMRMMLRIKM